MKEHCVTETVNVQCSFYEDVKKRLKVKVTLEQTMKAQRGSRGIAILFL
jgi:hypothetical protein